LRKWSRGGCVGEAGRVSVSEGLTAWL
jgi:hypothetical protein